MNSCGHKNKYMWLERQSRKATNGRYWW